VSQVATACFLEELGSHSIKGGKVEIAKLCQKAEHEYAGVMCGIMDQYISAMGADGEINHSLYSFESSIKHAVAGHALCIDCRSYEATLVPISDPTMTFVVCNTNVKHSLGDGAYNQRVLACEAGVKIIGKEGIKTGKEGLRDLSVEEIEAKKEELIQAGGEKGDYIYRYLR